MSEYHVGLIVGAGDGFLIGFSAALIIIRYFMKKWCKEIIVSLTETGPLPPAPGEG